MIHKILGNAGRMLNKSKGQYLWDNPTNWVLFNANLYTLNKSKYTKIWYGDIDLTLETDKLITLSKELGTIYVFHEMDGRFEYEEIPNIDKYVLQVTPKNIRLNPEYERYVQFVNGQFQIEKVSKEVKFLPEKDAFYDEEEFAGAVDITEALKMPRKKDIDPVAMLHEYVVKEFKKQNLKPTSVTQLYYSNGTEERFLELYRKILQREYNVSPDSYRAYSETNMARLDLFVVFRDKEEGPEWSKKNHVYFKVDHG